VRPPRAAELDEMWSFVGTKKRARWLWHALDPHTGRVLASVVGLRRRCQLVGADTQHKAETWEESLTLVSYAASAGPVMAGQIWNLLFIS